MKPTIVLGTSLDEVLKKWARTSELSANTRENPPRFEEIEQFVEKFTPKSIGVDTSVPGQRRGASHRHPKVDVSGIVWYLNKVPRVTFGSAVAVPFSG